MNIRDDRRKELIMNYYFLCECAKCSNEKDPMDMNLALCEHCGTGIYLLTNISVCHNCKLPISNSRTKDFNEVLEFTKEHLSNMQDVACNIGIFFKKFSVLINKFNFFIDLDVCKICLKKQNNLFDPLNIWRTKILDMAFESCINIEKWEEALVYGESLIPGFRKYNGDLNPLLGILYMKIGKICLFLNKNEKASKSLLAAETILKITHGNSHSLYKEQLLPILRQCTKST